MVKHFENRNAAQEDLTARGFHQLKNGTWLKDVCAASIHPTHNGTVVAVRYWEIEVAS